MFSLMALLVASILIAALVRMTGLAHRESMNEEIRMQANLIADSACDRALAKRQNHPDFQGEVWNIPSSQLVSGREATVRMDITSVPDEPSKKSLRMMVEYPINHPNLVRIQRQIPIF